MADGFLSQEEIDALLNGSSQSNSGSASNDNNDNNDIFFSEQDNDLLGEIGNISMGSASTALSQVINQSVNITTPVVEITTIENLKKSFVVPNILLEVEYTSGIVGKNILIMKITDAAVIANLMMGGDGLTTSVELSEIEVSAVQEAMNQMIGSAATAMATMFAREVNISPPTSKIWSNATEKISHSLEDEESVISISFHLKIGTLVDSTIMQVLPIKTAKKIISIMMGEDETPESISQTALYEDNLSAYIDETAVQDKSLYEKEINNYEDINYKKPVEVSRANFEELDASKSTTSYNNIDLIMDVPLDISVVLGKTKKSIKDVLSLGVGSVLELDKLADEPLEILVNGKKIATGEVVVIDESFGIRITNIATSAERIKSLK